MTIRRSTSSKQATTTQSKAEQGEVRIIGGQMRGRKIRFSNSEGLRPTLDRIRETLFNWLMADIYGANCLDLFAGSGALSFEAASRGASQVVMVEKDRQVCRQLNSNISTLALANTSVINQDFKDFLASNTSKFDIVFIDPPFGREMLVELLDKLHPSLNSRALVYVEHESENLTFKPDDQWAVLKAKRTSRICYSLLQLK